MEFRFKSSNGNTKELIKIDREDFETLSLKEELYSENKEVLKRIHLNNVFVISQDCTANNQEVCTLEVVQNQPFFLLQIVLNGDVILSLNDDQNSEIRLQSNMYLL